MKQSGKIGIVSWFGADNYGSNIQAAALQKALGSLGFNAVNISMEFSPDKARSFKNALWLALGRLKKKIHSSTFGALVGSIRERNTTRFVKSETEFELIDRHSRYHSLAKGYSAFMTGSDQLWNPDYINSFTTLEFAAGKRRISYATSIGTSSIPAEKLEAYRAIAGYHAISVRENKAKEILSKAIGRNDICVTADPTILLAKEDYLSMAENAIIPERIPKEKPFVFCYLVGQRSEYAGKVAEIAGDQEVIYVSGDLAKPNRISAVQFEEAGPYEWLWLIAHASCVVTDSFHAAVLSLICETSFCVLKRFDDNDVKSQNSRLTHLFESVGCGLQFDTLISSQESFSKAREHFDRLREHSTNYLKEALG